MQPEIFHGADYTSIAAHLVLQLAVILAAGKLGAELLERWTRLPGVLGELLAGTAIGPYALGGIPIPGFGPLIALPSQAGAPSAIPVTPELWSVAQIGAIVLLFTVGLETELHLLLRYTLPAIAVAIGGMVLPFALGDLATVAFGLAEGFASAEALFMGTIMTATSVGITARVLSDLSRLDSPEGSTILAAAVVDDILGIILLAVIVGLAGHQQSSAAEISALAALALGIWAALMLFGLLLSPWISRLFLAFRSAGASLALLIALAFLAAALAEAFGLAMIVGAYTIGLALSGAEISETLREPIEGIVHVFAPIFFVVTGMLVDFSAMASVLLFGLIVSGLAIVGKVAGCGLPALWAGFHPKGAARIGIGMVPRGEVAIIIAGAGLGEGLIASDLFGVSVMMTFVTTVLAPILLVQLFKGEQDNR